MLVIAAAGAHRLRRTCPGNAAKADAPPERPLRAGPRTAGFADPRNLPCFVALCCAAGQRACVESPPKSNPYEEGFLEFTLVGSVRLPRRRARTRRRRLRRRRRQRRRQRQRRRRRQGLDGQRLLVPPAPGRVAPADDRPGERHQARARAGRRQGRRHHGQVPVARRLDRAGRHVDAEATPAERPQGRAGRHDRRLHRRVQLGRLGDLDPDPQRGRRPADLARRTPTSA